MTHTYTYAILEVSAATHREIHEKLLKAGYGDQFDHKENGQVVIDMHGIALAAEEAKDDHVSVASIYGHATRRGLVELTIAGRVEAQLEPKKATEIGSNLIAAAASAAGDEAWMAFFTGDAGMSLEEAAAALLRLREIKQGSTSTVYPS